MFEEPSARNAHARVCEGGRSLLVTVNLYGHVAGNGGYSQGDTYGLIVASPTRKLHPVLGIGGSNF
jgi:hypothetical protein